MKFIHLIWTMLWRKKTRTLLTLLSIMIAFLLFGMLQGINAAFKEAVSRSNVNRLVVTSSVSFIESLPYADLAQIETIPGVAKVAYASWFGAYFQDAKNFVAAYAVDAAREFAVYPELKIPQKQLEALRNTRTGAIIGLDLAKKYGWKIGDRIPLHSTIWVKADGSSDWDFDLVGIYEDPADRTQEDAFFFNYKYLDEGRSFSKGRVGWYVVQVKDLTQSAQVAAAIDTLFTNSTDETKTQTEKEFQQAFLKQVGDIDLIITYILFSVFFALLFATGSTMMQVTRERIPELAVLKTLGFTDAGVAALVLSESLALCIFAALLGLGIAETLFPMLKDTFGVVAIPLPVVVEGILMAMLLAFTIGIIPALRAKRLVIAEALRS